MGIPTLIADSSSDTTDLSSIDFTSGIDSTYDEYMFVYTDIGPATDGVQFQVNFSTDGGSNYNVTKTTTVFRANNSEADSSILHYQEAYDLAQGTGVQQLFNNQGNASDESLAGILHLFSPASTTYVKHFYVRTHGYTANDYAIDFYVGGYCNTTSAVNAIQFNMSSGNLDGLVQMFGIK